MAIPRRLETKVGSNKAIIVLKLLPRYLKLLTASGIHPRDCNKGEDKTESVLQRVGRNFPTPHHRPDSKSRPLTKSNLSFSRSIIFTSTKKKILDLSNEKFLNFMKQIDWWKLFELSQVKQLMDHFWIGCKRNFSENFWSDHTLLIFIDGR